MSADFHVIPGGRTEASLGFWATLGTVPIAVVLAMYVVLLHELIGNSRGRYRNG